MSISLFKLITFSVEVVRFTVLRLNIRASDRLSYRQRTQSIDNRVEVGQHRNQLNNGHMICLSHATMNSTQTCCRSPWGKIFFHTGCVRLHEREIFRGNACVCVCMSGGVWAHLPFLTRHEYQISNWANGFPSLPSHNPSLSLCKPVFALRSNNNSCVRKYLGHPSFCHLSLSSGARRCHNWA